jgi:adenylate cyclase
MNIETERKFLVQGPFKQFAQEQVIIRQGYLTSDPERTVRVRTWNDQAFITIKGKTNESGLSRYEFETEIPIMDAEDLLKLCIGNLIEKIRYLVPMGLHIFEVDEFYGANEGLIIAEIELDTEDESFPQPDWLGEEVTGMKPYYNSYLAFIPYTAWDR